MRETEAFVEAALLGDGTVARELLRFRARSRLQQLVRSAAHAELVEDALNGVADAEGLRGVVADPKGFVARLATNVAEPEVARLQPALEPRLVALGLNWATEALPVLNELASKGWLVPKTERSRALGPVATAERKVLLRLLRPQLMRTLNLDGKALEEALKVFDLECSAEQLGRAVQDTEAFVEDALLAEGDVTRLLVRLRAASELQPLARSESHGQQVKDALGQLTELQALRAIVA